MVDQSPSQLAAAGALTGVEIAEISQLSTSVMISAATISAAAADDSFNDSGNGFVAAGFAVGDRVHVSGFTGNAANNIFSGVIATLTAGKMTISGAEGAAIVDDAAGESVTISKWVSVRKAVSELGGHPEGDATVTPPVAADFTLENAGTASMADGTNGLVLTAPSATVNARFMRYTAGLPGASWTLTMRGRPVGPHNAQVHVRAIIMRNSTNGRLVTFGDLSNTNTGVSRWSSYTAFASTPFSYGVNAADIPWRRVSSDGTTLSFYASCDGHEWALFGTEAIASYLTAAGGGSLDQVGIGLMIGAAPGVTQKNIFQHFTLV